MIWFILIIIISATLLLVAIVKHVEKKQEEEYIAKKLAEERYRKKSPDESYRDSYIKHYQSVPASSSISQSQKTPGEIYRDFYIKHQQATQSPDLLEGFSRYGVSAPNIRLGCPMLYRYPNLAVTNVNRDILRSIVKAKDFEVLPVKDEGGAVLLKWHGATVARLAEKVDMCTDWLDKKLPLRCEFAAFGAGKEKVALFFYKDQEATLQDRKCEVVKLTSCMSAAKQETISFLEEGEKLFVEWDDNDKPYLRDISYNPVGNLPARFTGHCENDLIDGIFFDHTETKESDDWEKEDKLIPYVRVYTSEE